MLQLRRPGPPRQRVQVTTPAQEVPFLPEHRPHGCQLPNQSTAVLTGFSGKTVPLERRRGGAQSLGTASRELWLNKKLGNTDAGEAQRPIKLLWWREGRYDPLPPVEAAFGTTSGLKKIAHEEEGFFFLFVIWCNTQEYCCIIALRTLSNCLNHCCSLRGLRL